jgi:hypothetical protein
MCLAYALKAMTEAKTAGRRFVAGVSLAALYR